MTWGPDVLRTLHAIIRPIGGTKPASGPLVIIHLCIRASTHRLRSYQTISSAEIALGSAQADNVADGNQNQEHPFVHEILQDYADVFSEKLQELPPERKLFHTIPMTPGHVTPARPAYRLAPPEYQEAYKQVHDLLEQGLIRPSCSSYSSSVLFVTKKGGSFRMVID